MHIHPIALGVAFVGVLAPLASPSGNRAVERSFARCGLLVACIGGFFVPAPLNWTSGLMFSLITACAILRNSYRRNLILFRDRKRSDDDMDN